MPHFVLSIYNFVLIFNDLEKQLYWAPWHYKMSLQCSQKKNCTPVALFLYIFLCKILAIIIYRAQQIEIKITLSQNQQQNFHHLQTLHCLSIIILLQQATMYNFTIVLDGSFLKKKSKRQKHLRHNKVLKWS